MAAPAPSDEKKVLRFMWKTISDSSCEDVSVGRRSKSKRRRAVDNPGGVRHSMPLETGAHSWQPNCSQPRSNGLKE